MTTIATQQMSCPECKGKGCGFCNGEGKIYFYPHPDSYDKIEIARANHRIEQRKLT